LFDLFTYLVEIGEPLVNVKELTPFSMRGVGRERRGFGYRCVDELEDERSAGDDALTAGQKVTAYDSVMLYDIRYSRIDWPRGTNVSRTLDLPAD
jgi:hypothetical protein